jgi:hypothetical protein
MNLKYLLALASFLFFLCALLLFVSIRQDERILDKAVEGQITAQPQSGEFVEELNRWVYNNQGFAKNQEYFIFRKLGPTPVQVLQTGGDCSDKSRLLAALLRRFDMDSTLVMLYACEGCEATHTVVEARYESGRMAADPVFDIVFPAGNGKFYGIRDLRNDPSKLLARQRELVAHRGSADKIALYKKETESYSWPKTINWDKNVILHSAAALMGIGGTDPYLVMRPHFFEDPKLFLMYMSLFFGATTGGGAWLLRKKAGSASKTSATSRRG